MQRIVGRSGSGLGAVGLKRNAAGRLALVAVETCGEDEPPYLRKSGMGGARYLRHCMESALLERGGLWEPETVKLAKDVLVAIDNSEVVDSRFERWVYSQTGETLSKLREEAWSADPGVPLQSRRQNAVERDWTQVFRQMAGAAEVECARPGLAALWLDWPREQLERFARAAGAIGEVTTALLSVCAFEERQFLYLSHELDAFAADRYHRFLSARYIRALCLFDSPKPATVHTEMMLPELTDLGRSILLLCAVGRLGEARELGARIRPFLGDSVDQFLPPLARMALAWATDLPAQFDTGRDRMSGTTLEFDCAFVLQHLADDESHALSDCLLRILDARERLFMNFDDEAHSDFDETLMTIVAAEVGAVNWWRRALGRSVLDLVHPLLALPVAKFPDMSSQAPDFVGLHAILLQRNQKANSGT